jgi:hypothetical protein
MPSVDSQAENQMIAEETALIAGEAECPHCGVVYTGSHDYCPDRDIDYAAMCAELAAALARAEAAETELAELRARRCETCALCDLTDTTLDSGYGHCSLPVQPGKVSNAPIAFCVWDGESALGADLVVKRSHCCAAWSARREEAGDA